MARPVYSVQLYEGTLTAGSEITVTLPEGYRWVIRDIAGHYSGDPTGQGGHLEVTVNGLTIYELLWPISCYGPFHEEMRVVAPGPSEMTLEVVGTLALAEIVISGYQLAA